MNRRIGNLLTVLGLTAAMALAQGPNGRSGRAAAPQTNAGLNMAKVQVVQGTISAVQIAYGVQYPAIVINQTQIKVAPALYLLENDFELAVGESVRVTAAPCYTANDPYLYAVDITKTSSGARITLRSELGIPLWTGASRRSGSLQAPRTGGNCVDTASVKTATGIIDRVTLGAGIQHPTLVLKVSDVLLTIELGPERILLDSDMELTPGASLTVKYAATSCSEAYVALQITDADGHTLLLRNDDGTPAWIN